MNEFEKLREKYNIKLPSKGYLFVKRVMDIMCSALALIVLSPILLITALAIKLESPGPVVFVQKRVGIMVNNLICINLEACVWMLKKS